MRTESKLKLICDSCGGSVFDQGFADVYCGACQRHIARRICELTTIRMRAINDGALQDDPDIKDTTAELVRLGYEKEIKCCYMCGLPTDNHQGLCDECKNEGDTHA